MLARVVLTGEGGLHQVSCFAYLCYQALRCMIGFSFFCFHHLLNLIKIKIIYSLIVASFCYLILKRSYFAFLIARKRAQKSEQRKLREVLCLQGLRHASRARRMEEKKYD